MLGIAVAVLAMVAVVTTQAADEARDEAKAASAQPAAHDHASHAASSAVSLPLQSFAGKTAQRRGPAAATSHSGLVPAVPAGDLVRVRMTLKDMVIEIPQA